MFFQMKIEGTDQFHPSLVDTLGYSAKVHLIERAKKGPIVVNQPVREVNETCENERETCQQTISFLRQTR